MPRTNRQVSLLSNVDIVTIALFQLGGSTSAIDIEDIAVYAFKLAPDRFSWRKYPKQISLQDVRFALENAQRPQSGYVFGGTEGGWMLTESGHDFAKQNTGRLSLRSNSGKKREPLSEQRWRRSEKSRILRTEAFQKFRHSRQSEITSQDAWQFFRIDEYVRGDSRKRRLSRVLNAFRDDPDIGDAVVTISKLLDRTPQNVER